MKTFVTCLISVFCCLYQSVVAQNIVYTQTDKDLSTTTQFQIMGKSKGNILIYFYENDAHSIVLYNSQMEVIQKNSLKQLPNSIFNNECVQVPDGFLLFYQYQKKGIVYAMSLKIETDGSVKNEPQLLDTTDIDNTSANKIYKLIYSDDKQYFMLIKEHNSNGKRSILTTVLFENQLGLKLVNKVQNQIEMPDKYMALHEYQLDNDGDMLCVRTSGFSQSDQINKITILQKNKLVNTIEAVDLPVENLYLDDLKIKVDNRNKTFLLLSFFSKQKRGDIDGLFFCTWNKTLQLVNKKATIPFDEELRRDANPENNSKVAFNDFFLRNIVLKQDGSFIIAAENVYSSSRGNNLNRWDYFNPSFGGGAFNNSYYGTGFGNSFFPWSRYNSFNNINRYFAENVVILSVNSGGELDWRNTVLKTQVDDNSDNFIGYGVLNSGSELHFLFNMQEKRQTILSDQSITPEGQLIRLPAFRNLRTEYDFMPKFAKQTGLKQIVIPCLYRSYLCFSKIDF